MSPRLSIAFSRAACLLLLGSGACQFNPSDAEQRLAESLEQTMTLLNQRQQRAARATEQRLAETVERNHWQKRDVEVLKQVQAIRRRTDNLSRYLQGLHAEAGANGVAGAGADTLQQRLNAYVRFIRPFVPAAAPLALDGPDDPRLREPGYKQLREWRFAELAFRGAAPASALVTLQRLEVEARRLEHDALAELSKQIGSPGLVFDKIGPMVMAESQQVPAGGTYRAALFLSSSWAPRPADMQADGRPVPVGPDGRGRVEFVVPAGAPAGPAAWLGSIRVRHQGLDTTYRLRVPYTVKPR